MTTFPQTFDDAVTLAQALVRHVTMTPASGERALLEQVKPVLERAGFTVAIDPYDPSDPGRCSLVAQLNPDDPEPCLLFGGHIDTVQLGAKPWKGDPFAARITEDGLLYGRGSTDMKSGVAAFTTAACRLAPLLGRRNIIVQMYGGEEAGCLGSFHVVQNPDHIRNVGAIVIGEPSNAVPLVGHKGALWFTLETHGVTSHASMPQKGVNALHRMLRGAARVLEELHPDNTHPVLGGFTRVFSTMHSGMNSNSVPDHAMMTIDMRTVPGQNHAELAAEVARLMGPDVEMIKTLDIPPVWTDPDDPWVRHVFDLLTPAYGQRPGVKSVQFFTDAAALRSALPDTPVIVLGPGDPLLAHQTDEYCPVEQIRFVEQACETIIRDWYGIG